MTFKELKQHYARLAARIKAKTQSEQEFEDYLRKIAIRAKPPTQK